MNQIYQLYFLLPQLKSWGFFGKAIHKINALVLKRVFDLWYPNYYARTASKMSSGITAQKRETQFIVSLTSFPARINDIWICIESLLRQTVKPDEIILWLANSQFPDNKIPESLVKLKSRGLTIRFCEDLRSHKKYYYAMKEYPKDCIITFDDDVYYPNTIIENLITVHKEFPQSIVANRVHEIIFSKEQAILPYNEWNHNCKNIMYPSNLLFQTGIAGVLYPPNSLMKDVFNKEIIFNTCLNADDLWLKIAALRNKTKIITNKNFNKDLITIRGTHNFSLIKMNKNEYGNDKQFQKICQHFSINATQFTDS